MAARTELLDVVRSIAPDDMLCTNVHQPRALGLVHAALWAKELVADEPFAVLLADEPFAVLLADDLMVGLTPIMKQMVEQFAHWRCSILAVQDVPREDTRRYGIVSGSPVEDDVVDVTGIVEKPDPDVAPSTLAVAGRYILTPGIFHELENNPRGVGGEIQMTDGIAQLLRREKVFAYRYEGACYDCGSKLGILQATVALGVEHDEVGEDFTHWLRGRGLTCFSSDAEDFLVT